MNLRNLGENSRGLVSEMKALFHKKYRNASMNFDIEDGIVTQFQYFQ